MKLFITFLISLIISNMILFADDEYSDFENQIKQMKQEVKKKITIDEIDSKQEVSRLQGDLKIIRKYSRMKPPVWVNEFPSDDEWFVGIGRSDYSGDLDNDCQMAMNASLSQLASQIQTKIRSRLETVTKERNYQVDEYAEQRIYTSVKNNLEGIELVDAWINKKQGIHYYYRLNKKQYYANQQKKFERARDLASKHFKAGLDKKKQGKKRDAIYHLLIAAAAVYPYPLDDGTITINGREYNVCIDARYELSTLLSNMSLSVKNKVYHSKNNEGTEFIVTLQADSTPLNNFPVYFIAKNEINKVVTGKTGSFVLSLKQLKESLSKVYIGIDCASLVGEEMMERDDFITLEKSLNLIRYLHIKRQGMVLFIEYDDGLESLHETIKDLFSRELHCDIVSDVSNAEQVLRLSMVYQQKPPNEYDIIIGEGIISLSLLENNKQKTGVYSTRLETIKASGLTKNQIRENISEKAIDIVMESTWHDIKKELKKLNLETFTIVEE